MSNEWKKRAQKQKLAKKHKQIGRTDIWTGADKWTECVDVAVDVGVGIAVAANQYAASCKCKQAEAKNWSWLQEKIKNNKQKIWEKRNKKLNNARHSVQNNRAKRDHKTKPNKPKQNKIKQISKGKIPEHNTGNCLHRIHVENICPKRSARLEVCREICLPSF